jgi:hypothetical protein
MVRQCRTESAMIPSLSMKPVILLLLGLFLFQGILFWPATMEFFTPDAIYYLARQVDSWEDFKYVFTHLDSVANYRPLTYLVATTLSLRWQLDPFPYHMFTLVSHVGITALVFWLARLLLRSDAAAFVAAVFFGLHSAALRVAFGITFISDLLYAAFFIFAIVAFVKGWHRFSLLSFVLALLSKEPAVTLPAVLTAMLLFVPQDAEGKTLAWREAIRRTRAFWIVGLIYIGWFALLTGGHFVPQSASHPYHVSLSWDDIVSKAQYLSRGFNLKRFDTMAAHPTITTLSTRLLPSGFNELFKRTSDFWLYLVGPVWMFWLVIKGEWQSLREIAMYALATPLVVISTFFLIRRNNHKTVIYGLLLFVFVLCPVLILPASKTMLHNLYVPVVGLAIVVGEFVRTNLRRLATLAVPAVLIVAGIHYIVSDREVSWPTTTARAASMYLEDVQRFHPVFPKGAVLYFESTGMPDWPFLTGGGDLFRVFYGDRTLVTIFGDNGEAPPAINRSARPVFRFREMDGMLLPVQ